MGHSDNLLLYEMAGAILSAAPRSRHATGVHSAIIADRVIYREGIVTLLAGLRGAATMSFMKAAAQQNATAVDNPRPYVGYRFPLDVISYAVW
ncbi:hypothetical protein [Paraburkholderia sp. CI3]|uniref:hypothetical protein n=1 Tax=Paraburkholderia sp. CI3 TaxID=2991060 RepID=UPI003D23A7FE